MTLKEFTKKIIASINPGTADISGIGDGTIKGAISELNKNLYNNNNYIEEEIIVCAQIQHGYLFYSEIQIINADKLTDFQILKIHRFSSLFY